MNTTNSSPILCVMPWMSWATSSCPEAMRAFSWLSRCRLSLSEFSTCSWPSCSFFCCACRALCPSNSLSKEAAVSSFSSSWPSCYQTQRWKPTQDPNLYCLLCTWRGKGTLPSDPSLHPVGLWLWRWERWQCAQLCVGRVADESRSKQSVLCCWLCGKHSMCLNPCLLYTLL